MQVQIVLIILLISLVLAKLVLGRLRVPLVQLVVAGAHLARVRESEDHQHHKLRQPCGDNEEADERAAFQVVFEFFRNSATCLDADEGKQDAIGNEAEEDDVGEALRDVHCSRKTEQPCHFLIILVLQRVELDLVGDALVLVILQGEGEYGVDRY